jgi:hypothetical protein
LQKKYPAGFIAAGGHTQKVDFPCVAKANGLTKAIIKFLTWRGHRATRINVSGRVINGKYVHSTTRRGTADISATINGKSVMLEIKSGKDKPSEHQIKEQILERDSGGVYEFIYNINGFFDWYDGFVK